jgi:fructokinase
VARLFGGVELGGTKVVCVVGRGDVVHDEQVVPTSDPEATLASVVAFFEAKRSAGFHVEAVGVASFGPVELRPGSPLFGHVTHTPKPGWSGVDVVAPLRDRLGVPVGFDTDVNGAALAEGQYGAAAGLDSYVYVTVGTGIGGGAVVGGRLVHGLVHPEIGHVSVPREPDDDFPGRCPFHRDCLEGMASGTALAERFGAPAETLTGVRRERAVACAAWYLAYGIRSIVYTLAPERVVVGGGVSQLEGLFPLLRRRFGESLGGYPQLPEHDDASFVSPTALAGRAGAIGALMLAELAAAARAV